jgi:hypothetical protein
MGSAESDSRLAVVGPARLCCFLSAMTAYLCSMPAYSATGDPTPVLGGLALLVVTAFSIAKVVKKRRFLLACAWYVYIIVLFELVGFQGFVAFVVPMLLIASFFSIGPPSSVDTVFASPRGRPLFERVLGSRLRVAAFVITITLATGLGVIGRTERLPVWVYGAKVQIVDVSIDPPRPLANALVRGTWWTVPFWPSRGVSVQVDEKTEKLCMSRAVYRSNATGEVSASRYIVFELLNPGTHKHTNVGTDRMDVFLPGYVSLRALFDESHRTMGSFPQLEYPLHYAKWQQLLEQRNADDAGATAPSIVAMVPDPRPLSGALRDALRWNTLGCEVPSDYVSTLREIVQRLSQHGVPLGKATDPMIYVDERGCTMQKRCFATPHGNPIPCDRDESLSKLLSRADSLEAPASLTKRSVTVEESEVLSCNGLRSAGGKRVRSAVVN